MIVLLWLLLFTVFMGSYVIFFGYFKLHAGRPWGFGIDPHFCPSVSVLISVHNEGKVILSKLKNLAELSYPREKTEFILIDDASTDETVDKVYDFVKTHPELTIKTLRQSQRLGKSNALNKGLQVASNDIIVVTDADTVLPSDILHKTLPYMSSPVVGAVTGQGVARNASQCWVTRAESSYLNLVSLLRLGESKIYSTIRFEGCFAAFKKNSFSEFDNESGADDSGTALRIVQNKFRTVFVPEAIVIAEAPSTLRSRIKTKTRRASHMTRLWVQCLGLLFERRLVLPKKIVVPEIFISLINPFVFVALTCTTMILVAYYPIVSVPLILAFLAASLVPKAGDYLVHGIFDQFILVYSVFLNASKRKYIAWETERST